MIRLRMRPLGVMLREGRAPSRVGPMRAGPGCSLLIIAASMVGIGPASNGAYGERAFAESRAAGAWFLPSQELTLPAASPERQALEHLNTGQAENAVTVLRRALGKGPRRYHQGRMRWLLAKAYAAQEDTAALRATLRALAHTPHPLAHRARLWLASELQEEDPAQALTLLGPIQAGYAISARAQLLRGQALMALGRRAEAIQVLEALVSQPRSGQRFAASMPLADLLAASSVVAHQLRAVDLYRGIQSHMPLSSQGREAEAKAAALVARLPKSAQAQVHQPSIEDRFATGEAFIRAHAYSKAVDHFAELARDLQKDAHLSCEARLQHGRSVLKKRDRRDAVALLEAVLKDCQDPEQRAWAYYYAGQGHAKLGNDEEALAHYDALHALAPQHRLADDALYEGALSAESLDDTAGAQARLKRLVEQHPTGDMRAEALFRLAWQAHTANRHREALDLFQTLSQRPEYEQREGVRGRAAYWRARTLQLLGQKGAAAAAYEAVVRAQRLSYHAQQALSRLAHLDRKRYQRLLAEARPTPPTPLRFPREPYMALPAFKTAEALLQVGEVDAAKAELRELDLLDREHRWLVAAMYDASNAYPEASLLARRQLDDFASAPPRGEDHSRWLIAYPKAYAPEIERAAREAKVPVAYVRAVAREESAFDPRAVSTAHAYGLIQLIGPTARQFAKPLGLPSHPEALMTPAINLRIGSHFIQYLYERFSTNPAVVPAAYNAGPGAVDRWLRERPRLPLDEWVEEIPYAETRRYTRRVLQTYGTYAFLENGRFPPLPQRLPRKR